MTALRNEYTGGKEISQAELSLLLRKIDGDKATNLWLVAETETRMNVGGKKRENPLCDEKCRTLSKFYGMINFNYENSVNNQLKREGEKPEFESKENWHTSSFDQFNGCVKEKKDGTGEYIAIKQDAVERVAYLVNDKEADAQQQEAIKKYKIISKLPENQGTEIPIIYRTIMLKNIRMIKMFGTLYYVTEQVAEMVQA